MGRWTHGIPHEFAQCASPGLSRLLSFKRSRLGLYPMPKVTCHEQTAHDRKNEPQDRNRDVKKRIWLRI